MSAPSGLLVLRRLTVVIALVATILGVLPGPDVGATPPETLSAAGQKADFPEVAVDQDGDAVIVWKAFDGANFRVQARRRSAAGALSPTQTVSAAGEDADYPQVAVDQDGDAVVVWARFDGTNSRVQARRRSAAGALSPVQALSVAGQSANRPQVAVDQDGHAVIVWQIWDGATWRVQARRRSAGGALSPVQTLSTAGQDAYYPQVAVDQDGHAVVVWQRFDGTTFSVQARRRSAAGALSPVETLSAAGQNAHVPQVAVDQDGDAVIAWHGFDGTNSRIQARRRSKAGALSAVKKLSAAGRDAHGAQVAVDQDGHAVIVWERHDGTNWRIQAMRRSAAGALSAVQTLSAAGQSADDPHVAVDADGHAVIVWERHDGTSYRVQARRRSAAGALSAVQTLSAAGQSAQESEVAVDQDGDAVIVWRRFDGTNNRIQSVGL
ncbi:MAG: hypothetical protein M3245_00485 [Actinomycetota bacterium]|nr:hypothetical protein [Actinomycetota bacterium]